MAEPPTPSIRPDVVLCPGCLRSTAADKAVCDACGEAVGGLRLRLVGPLEHGPTSTLAGFWQVDDGDFVPAAVKVLDVATLGEARAQERFRRQPSLLARVDHPRVPRMLGEHACRGRRFLAVEWVEGESLERRLRDAHLSCDQARRLLDDLLDILAHLHERGIVHRNVTPGNIIVDGGSRAHLIDFGAACLADGSEVEPPEPTVVGTPGFMAPEHSQGKLTFASDVYAAGKVIEASLGEAPADRALNRLLARLVVEDWRRRPSARQALAKLRHPPRRIPPAALAAASLVGLAGIVAAAVHGWRTHPAASVQAPPRMPAPLDAGVEAQKQTEDQRIEAFFKQWAAAQVQGGFERYAAFYSRRFSTVVRDRRGEERTLDRARWLERNRAKFDHPMEVTIDSVDGAREPDAGVVFPIRVSLSETHATVSMRGNVLMRLEPAAGSYLIIDEHTDYDETEGGEGDTAPRSLHANKEACSVSFDPSGAKWLAVMPGGPRYLDALAVAARLRRAHRKAEIIDGRDFAALGRQFWVAVATANDKAAFRRLPEGAIVIPGQLSADVTPTNLRWLGELPVSGLGCQSPLITVDASWAYGLCETGRRTADSCDSGQPCGSGGRILRRVPFEEPARALDAGTTVEEIIDLSPLGGATPIRLAQRARQAYLVDDRGRWFLVSAGRLEAAAAFEPAADEGKVASCGDWTYRIATNVLHAEHDGKEAFEIALLPYDKSQVFAVGDSLVIRSSAISEGEKLIRFLVLPELQPRRLSKLCGVADGNIPFSGVRVAVGGLRLASTLDGALEVWTSLRGIFGPDVKYTGACNDDEDEYPGADSTAIFEGHPTIMNVRISCYERIIR